MKKPIFTLYLANCCGTDVDNDHSEDPKDWITPADFSKALRYGQEPHQL